MSTVYTYILPCRLPICTPYLLTDTKPYIRAYRRCVPILVSKSMFNYALCIIMWCFFLYVEISLVTFVIIMYYYYDFYILYYCRFYLLLHQHSSRVNKAHKV